MRETVSPPLEGKAFLLANDVPTELITTMKDNGKQPDYLNCYVGPSWYFLTRYNPKNPDNQLEDPEAGKDIRTWLKRIPTYKEYWHERITKYNRNAQERKVKKVPVGKTLDLIMKAYSPSETLNLLTLNLRRVANSRFARPSQLITAFVIADSNTAGILQGEWEAQKSLYDFGLKKHLPLKKL